MRKAAVLALIEIDRMQRLLFRDEQEFVPDGGGREFEDKLKGGAVADATVRSHFYP